MVLAASYIWACSTEDKNGLLMVGCFGAGLVVGALMTFAQTDDQKKHTAADLQREP
jgi:hypothetical protein